MLIQVKVYLFLEMKVHTLSNENIFHWSLSVSIFEVVDYDQTQDLPESRFYGMKVYLVEFCYLLATICILGLIFPVGLHLRTLQVLFVTFFLSVKWQWGEMAA